MNATRILVNMEGLVRMDTIDTFVDVLKDSRFVCVVVCFVII